MTNEEVVSYLQENPILQLRGLEKEAGLSGGLLSKIVKGDRVLNESHLKNLLPVLIKYGFKHENQHLFTHVISILNHKGAVGKTTTTLNLGKALSILGKRVLVIDLDAQGHLSQRLGVCSPKEQVANALKGGQPLPRINIADGFDLSPSDLDLAYLDLELVQTLGGFNRLNNAINPVREIYDYILIDCPPALNIFTFSALAASNGCLVTIKPEIENTQDIDKTLSWIEQQKDKVNNALKIKGVVFTRVNTNLMAHQNNIEYVRQHLPNFTIFKTLIREHIAMTESRVLKQDVFTYNSQSQGADDYMNLAKEIMK